MKNTPAFDETESNSEELSAEQHVAEIMGPTWGDRPASSRQSVENEVISDIDTTISTEVNDENAADSQVADDPEPKEQTTEGDANPAEDSSKSSDDSDEPNDEATENDTKESRSAVDGQSAKDSTVPQPVVMKESLGQKIKDYFYIWWDNRLARYLTLGLILVVLGVILGVPVVRTATMNALGFRASISATVVDKTTLQPLKNAALIIGDSTVKTDVNGHAKLSDVRLGSHTVVISKAGFAKVTRPINFGFRAVDLGEVGLTATGNQYAYVFTDYLSGKPVEGVAVTSGDASTKSDKDGKALLTVGPNTTDTITATKASYRDEVLSTPSQAGQIMKLSMVPRAKVVYVTKASGKYDVYKMYADGKDTEVLLAGSGLETQQMSVLPNPVADVVAVASTREDKRNRDGYLLTALNIVDVSTGELTNVEYAEQVSLIGWHGNTLVYGQIVAGTSAANAARQKIVAYDVKTDKRYQLASANYFSGVQLIGNVLYYATSFTDPTTKSVFGQIDLDGNNKKTLLTDNIWSVIRTGYKTMKIQTQDKWYDFSVGDSSPVESKSSANSTSLTYLDSSNGQKSVRVDSRDANGVLMLWKQTTSQENELATMNGTLVPEYWLNDSTIVFQISSGNIFSQYIVNTDSGTPKKLRPLTE